MISPLAVPSDKLGYPMFRARGTRRRPLYGIMLHTTGSGLPKSSPKTAKDTLRRAAKIYTKTGGPHYVIGWDGTIVATIADENTRGAHGGISRELKPLYTRGGWESRVSPRGVTLWRKRWSPLGAKNPADLVPDKSLLVNDYWIGIEMIPVTPGGSTLWAQPKGRTRFTEAQHRAARELSHDIAKRHGFPSNWSSRSSSRLVGHSDLNPITRDSPSLPLWDPGYHIGLFDLDYVRKSELSPLAITTAALAGWLIYKLTR